MGTDDIQNLFKVTEIAVPPGSDYRNRSPKTAPFPVMTDDNVTVTATLVSHYDVYPAFGFRFDLKKSGVSVTFSGDTTKSDNLIALAKDTDILVHEAQFSLDDAYYDNRFPPNYLMSSHTSAEQVGEVAAAANAKHVILSHYEPTDLPDSAMARCHREALLRQGHRRPRRPGLRHSEPRQSGSGFAHRTAGSRSRS